MRAFWVILLTAVLSLSSSTAMAKDTLLVGYTEVHPFVFVENGRVDGLSFRIWDEVMEREGHAYKLVNMPFNEVLESLKSGRIDATIMPLSITWERSKTFQFSTPYFAAHGAVAIANPSPFKNFTNGLKSFVNSNFLKGVFILILIIFIFGLLGWYFEWKDNSEHFRKGVSGLWDGIWWSAVTLTTVGYGDKTPKTVWGKLAALLLMFGGLLFVSGITASIASNVVVNEISNDFSSLDRLKSVRVGTLANSQIHEYLKTHFFKDIQGYSNIEEGLNALAKGELKGFMYDEQILRSEIAIHPLADKLVILPIKYDATFYGFGFAKGLDSLSMQVSQSILTMRDDRDWQMLLHEYGLSDFN
jgi:ABC-type amino acid transport substrate-binding protein